MAIKDKKAIKKTVKSDQKKSAEKSKKISKTWLAFQQNIGTGEILDMRAVLK